MVAAGLAELFYSFTTWNEGKQMNATLISPKNQIWYNLLLTGVVWRVQWAGWGRVFVVERRESTPLSKALVTWVGWWPLVGAFWDCDETGAELGQNITPAAEKYYCLTIMCRRALDPCGPGWGSAWSLVLDAVTLALSHWPEPIWVNCEASLRPAHTNTCKHNW